MPEVTYLDADELVINMGPQHPATHGVLRVKLKLDGERVTGSECIIGYLHRGIEKIAENRTYQQFAPYVDRMDYVAAVTNGMGYCEARLTTHAFRIGGLLYDLYDGFEKEVRKFSEMFLGKIDEYEQLLTKNRIWLERTQNVGILKAEDAIAYAVTGPVLRGSGVKWDVRKAQPYEAYDKVEFDVPVGRHEGWGDTYDRYLVRLAEMRQSVRIIRQSVERLESGPIFGKVGKIIKPPAGFEVYHAIESPKGELGYLVVSDGTTHPYRVRVRPPSFVNLQAFDLMARGHLIADVVAIIGTIDIVLGEVDR